VIIGGGVVGLSIAYHLTVRSYHDVVVVERRTLGAGATSKGTGGIRQQFSSEINIALSVSRSASANTATCFFSLRRSNWESSEGMPPSNLRRVCRSSYSSRRRFRR
jgi:cation diffusion facilitator CzcD-associated flavoprotein CzcO